MIKLQRKQHKKKTKEKGKIMQDTQKTKLFEETAIPKAVAQLAVPTILSSLVMVIYNLADTYFVGMLNNSTQSSSHHGRIRCFWHLMRQITYLALEVPV